jgi:hypothetical protein
MIRAEKVYGSPDDKSGQYTTFRTISNAVKATKGSPKWIRRATKGKNLSGKVSEYVARLAPKTFEAYVAGL